MKKILFILLIAVTIVVSVSVVSAGLFDFNDNADAEIKTHEFNYMNIVTFNISDVLTNNTDVKNISFGGGVMYDTPVNEKGEFSTVGFKGVGYDTDDPIESHRNDKVFEEIETNKTSQGYDTYTFKWTESEMYEVFVDLDNITLGSGDDEVQYHYFLGAFKSLEEANIFIETFKVNDKVNEGV